MPDLSAVSKKVGPLPLWGWALAVTGAFIGFRVLSGRAAFGSSSAAAPVSGVTAPPSNLDTGAGTDPYGGANSTLLEDMQAQIAGLSSGLTNATAFSNLQQKLIYALSSRTTAYDNREKYTRAQADNYSAYQANRITRDTYLSKATYYQTQLAQANNAITFADKLIADLKAQMAQIGTVAA